MLRYLTAGESHGPALTVILEGVPAGLALPAEEIRRDLARRQGGFGRGGRMKIEQDDVRFTGGLRGGVTLGSPLSMVIENRDWANWSAVMDPGPEAKLEERTLSRPRPGHADLAGGMKYRQRDLRNILERSSARETAARVAAGAVARLLLKEAGMVVASHVLAIGEVSVQGQPSREEILAAAGSPVYCAREEEGRLMQEAILRARSEGDSLGGVFEVQAWGVPAGLGSHVQWDRRLDGLLAQALMSIPAIKGVEVGAGFAAAALPGSRVHDEIFFENGQGFYRKTNRAGGLEGGITNGEPLVVRAAMKPIPTLMKPLHSVDILTLKQEAAGVERSDVCAAPAASVVGEAAVSFTLAAVLLEKCGGDHLAETLANLAAYRSYLKEAWHGAP